MLKVYVKATDLIDRLRNDKAGVVSFEYLIVAVLIIGAVGIAYGAGGANIASALSTGIVDVTNAFTAAL
jgi:pilus assembly protein Flp/PilA